MNKQKVIEFNASDGFLISQASRRIHGLEDAIAETSVALKGARDTLRGVVREELQARGIEGEQWSLSARPDGTVCLTLNELPPESAKAPAKKRLRP